MCLPQVIKSFQNYRGVATTFYPTLVQWGVAWFPKGIIYDTAITTPVSCSLQHNTFPLGLGRPEPH